jgi:hypothetical protein
MRPGHRCRQPEHLKLAAARGSRLARGIDGYLLDGPKEIDPTWLTGKQKSE